MSFMLVAAALLAGCLVLLLWSERREWRTGVWIFKPACSGVFVGVALLGGATEHAFGRLMVAGLVLSAAGDVLLIPRGDGWFRAGLASFLLAHVVYAWAFASQGPSFAWVLGGLLVTGLVGLWVLRWLAPHVPPGLTLPVSMYVAVISVMVASAAGAVGGGSSVWVLGAATAFWVSDVFVARRRFVRPGFANKLWGLPLYYAAQLAFAWLAWG